MAGHSKWENIRHRKGAQDAKRAKMFAKFSKEITVAALKGMPDPEMNPSLRLAMSKARAQSMPKKNIEAAIDKAKGGTNGANYEDLVYAANVSGVSFLILCLTDNKNRTAADVQHIISKAGGQISGASSVSYIFDRKGVLEVAAEGKNEEEFMMLAVEAGAEDFVAEGESFYIYTDPSNFGDVKDAIEKAGIEEFKTAEVKYIPNQEVVVPADKAEKILSFIDALEDNDDVQDVYHNLDADSIE